MSTTSIKQILKAKSEVETSLENAKSLRDQWMEAIRCSQNSIGLNKKQVDYKSKAFKNRVLTVKWDCEDLEELVSIADDINPIELAEVRQFIDKCRIEISALMSQLEEIESNNKIFNKHGITMPNPVQTQQTTTTVALPCNSNGSMYEQSMDGDRGEIHFDKSQIETSTTIFNNALYDHLEIEERLNKSINASLVFNNLTRPIADVYMNPNDSEMILDMLETEHYEPPAGLLNRSRYAVRKLYELDRTVILKRAAIFLTFPTIIFLFLLAM